MWGVKGETLSLKQSFYSGFAVKLIKKTYVLWQLSHWSEIFFFLFFELN